MRRWIVYATAANSIAILALTILTIVFGPSIVATRDKVSPCVGPPTVQNSPACQQYREDIARSGSNTVSCINFERATGRTPRRCDQGVQPQGQASQGGGSQPAASTPSQQPSPPAGGSGGGGGGSSPGDGTSTTTTTVTGTTTGTTPPTDQGPVGQIAHHTAQTVDDIGHAVDHLGCQLAPQSC